MPRRKNTEPTSIYWLQDIRPETIAAGWAQGLPFYVGKTIRKPEYRLKAHVHSAAKRSRGKVGARILECDGYVRIVTLETVSPDEDWCAREKYWIATSRRMFPGHIVNVSDGGAGAPGMVQSSEHRAKISAGVRGRKHTDESRAKMRMVSVGRKPSPEAIEKAAAVCRGRRLSPEHRAKVSAAMSGKKKSPEAIAKMVASQRGRKQPPEAVVKAWATRRANAERIACSK